MECVKCKFFGIKYKPVTDISEKVYRCFNSKINGNLYGKLFDNPSTDCGCSSGESDSKEIMFKGISMSIGEYLQISQTAQDAWGDKYRIIILKQ